VTHRGRTTAAMNRAPVDLQMNCAPSTRRGADARLQQERPTENRSARPTLGINCERS
jgi:hypothetical protein